VEPSKLAQFAPSVRIYSVPGLARVTVPALALGVPGTLGPVKFVFPSLREVSAILVIPELGTPEELAAISLEIVDEDGEAIFSDQLGDPTVPRLPFAMPCESMFGRGLRPFPLKRLVRPSDRWFFTFRNPSAAAVNVAGVALFHEGVR
jgi:hypothetical protein